MVSTRLPLMSRLLNYTGNRLYKGHIPKTSSRDPSLNVQYTHLQDGRPTISGGGTCCAISHQRGVLGCVQKKTRRQNRGACAGWVPPGTSIRVKHLERREPEEPTCDYKDHSAWIPPHPLS